MDEVEQSLEVPQDTATSQEEIKCQLAEHKVRGLPCSLAPWRGESRRGQLAGCGEQR